ncbi:unnamed protein product [Microthlaspi erraticum]|uniref:DUF1216 domain-containing protein n=1 Tax=Microthlaspi erraticum TaxID=1685480 RepID=A0A6D2LDA4_9BRAS|nr:unnamed protein product [Microthlaspi erraticum]
MARAHLLLCFTILFASVTLLDVVSSTLNFKPALPQIADPQTVAEVEPYTIKVVMVFVGDLEKQCPKTSKFKMFFEKLRGFAKYVCPIRRLREKNYETDMKAKAGGLFQAISSFAIGKIRAEIQEEKNEAIANYRFMKTLAGKILGGRKKDETEDTMKLTAEQQKEIKEGILKWETVIAKVTTTMVQSTTTSSSASEGSASAKEVSAGGKQDSASGSSYKDTTGSSSSSGSPSESPSGSKSSGSSSDESISKETGSKGSSSKGSSSEESSSKETGSKGSSSKGSSSEESSSKETGSKGSSSKGSSSKVEAKAGGGASFEDSTGGSPSGSPSNSPSETSTSTKSSGKVEASESASGGASASSGGSASVSSQKGEISITEVETQTSEQVMTFLMGLEKKCPQKEEYKSFFEKLKGTMTTTVRVKRGFFSGLRAAVGKVGDAMAFMRSRIGTRSAEMKTKLETCQAEVVKAMEELDAIHAQIVSQNKGKKGGAMTCTAAQQAEIKVKITKWEQVTTQFVEATMESEASSSASASSSSSSGKLTSGGVKPF